MPARPFRLSPRADRDLEKIWLYTFEHWSLAQADMYQRELGAAFEGLADGTKKGRKVDVRPGYLKYAHRAHVIYFRDRGDHLEIVRILHSKMDVNRHL